MSPLPITPRALTNSLREIVAEVSRIAEQLGLPPSAWVDSLLDDPFAMPAAFQGHRQADGLADLFDALRNRIGDDAALAQTLAPARENVRRIIESLPDSPLAGTLGGGLLGVAESTVQKSTPTRRYRGGQHAKPPGGRGTSVPPALLGAEEGPPPAAAPAPLPPERRWINAGILGHDGRAPLAVDTDYVLEFDVALEKKKDAVGTSPLPDSRLWFEETEEVADVTIQVDSTDFAIAQKTLQLKVPLRGPSIGKARFDVRPLQAGSGVIVATFHKAGNFLTQMELTFAVGVGTGTENTSATIGRVLDGATKLQPRDLGLLIRPAAGVGYDCVVWGAVQAQVKLPFTAAFLTQAIVNAREKLMEVVMQKGANGKFVFQTGVKIPQADADKALVTLRDAGALLFEKLFFGPDAGPDVENVGNFLKQQATAAGTRLKLQIVSTDFPVPWPILYVGEPTGPVDWECFLGMRHIIEQIPLQPNLSVPDSTIASDAPSLSVSVNVNAGIDTQMKADFVKRQREYWKKTAASTNVRLVERELASEVRDALGNAADDQLLYLYCHAITTGIGDKNGIDSSCLVLTNDEKLTLGDLTLKAPRSRRLPGHPLVILNACESAELSPMFYAGFVPYFMSKGARGVVGTECKTPALFATEWALKFFPMFLSGTPMGEAMLTIRRDAWTEWNNPLGLLYAVHCDGDTRVAPALSV